MLPRTWMPVGTSGLARIGSQHDGGYVVSLRSISEAKLLLSMGLNDDWSFEEKYVELAGGPVICCDHTVHWRFWMKHFIRNLLRGNFSALNQFLKYRSFFSRDGVEHRPVMVGYDGPGTTSLASLLKPGDQDIFLKIDIEGWEYRILHDIVAEQGRFTSVAIEFHNIDLHRDRISQFLKDMTSFSIVYIHGNNYGGVDANGDPIVLELTLLRNDYLDQEGAPSGYSGPEPEPNHSSRPDIVLVFA